MAPHPNLGPRDGPPPARARGGVAPRLVPVLRACTACRTRRDPGPTATRVAVVIPARDEEPNLPTVLAGLASQTAAPPRGRSSSTTAPPTPPRPWPRRGAPRCSAARRSRRGGAASRGRSTRGCAPRRHRSWSCLDADVDPSPHLLARLGAGVGRAGRARVGAAVPRDAPLVGARRGVLQPRRRDGRRAGVARHGAGPGPGRVWPVPRSRRVTRCSPTSTTGRCAAPSSRTSRSPDGSPPRPARPVLRRR